MLRRFGPWAMGVLIGAGAACGQEPIPASIPATGMPGAELAGPVAPLGHISHDPHGAGWLRQRAMSDPLGANAELAGLRREANPWHSPQCEAPGKRYGHGPGLLGRKFGDPDAALAGDFQAANAWSSTNVEKRLFILYQHHTPYLQATKIAYGHSNGAQVGMEVLPWVLRDDDAKFTRIGWTAAFDYRDYDGNTNAIIVSRLSGNTLASGGGHTFGSLLGATWRTDFHVFGLRVSPNLTAGINLDWTSMRETPADPAAVANLANVTSRPPNELLAVQPTVLGGPDFAWLTPQGNVGPVTAGNASAMAVDRIVRTDFSVGGYLKAMLDVPVRKNLNFGVGMDIRMNNSKAFLDNDRYKRHVGLLLQLGGDF